MHFSETSFIRNIEEAGKGYDARIFTPLTEVPFAGHPTLGTAYVIKHFIAKEPKSDVTLNLKIGAIQVTCEKQGNQEIFWMRQVQPMFGKRFPTDYFQKLLGLKASDFDLKFPIQEVSTGLPFVIVPLRTLDAVKRARISPTALPAFLKQEQAGILVFCPETYHEENSLNVRVFVDAFGIPEDPATGSGNGCLAAYLSHYRYFGSSQIGIKVEQGFEIRRPSILHLRAKETGEKFEVNVGGKVLLIAKGKLA